MHTRPWRSSPLAGPAFLTSTLPPVIPEGSEESHENELLDSPRAHPLSRSTSSSSIASLAGSLTASGYDSRNTSSSASALMLVDGYASTSSSVTLAASTGAHGTSSSHGHTSSQTHPARPKRLSKSWGRRPSSAQGNFAAPKNVRDVPMTLAPRARTVSHSHSRPTSLPVQPVSSSPQLYARSPRSIPPTTEANTTKQQPSVSRDPSSNWMSSSPFGPAETPKFSRLAMASPAVVMPLSAREYRKQKSIGPMSEGKQKVSPTSSNRVTFIDNAMSAFQSPDGVPAVKVSPPPAENVPRPPSSPDHSSDRSSQPQPQVDHPPSKPLPQASMSPRPSSPKQKRPRSRPNTPPRSSPLAARPLISPKSSTGTFFSFTSSSDEDTSRPYGGSNDSSAVPPARPRPRRRRKSYPDRLSNGARLSLLEAVDRLSQESASLQPLPTVSQTNELNRLSVASQASGRTLFYDVESDVEQGQVTTPNGNGYVDSPPRSPAVLHTQSLEDLSSTLARTGIEVVDGRSGALDVDDEGRKGKRNVRVVRISDKVEVSPPPVPRRRKLTKSRPSPARRSTPAPGAAPAPGPGTVKEVKAQTQTQDRLTSLLPWKSKGASHGKRGVHAGSGAAAPAAERDVSTPAKGLIQPPSATPATPVPNSVSPIASGSTHVESHARPIANGSAKKMPSDRPPMSPSPGPVSPPSTPPRKSRRYTFSFLPSPTFHRHNREKSNSAPPSLDPHTPSKSKGILKGVDSGTDSTSTSIRTIMQGSQSTIVPMYDLTTPASSGTLFGLGSGSGRGSRSSVPMLHRVTAQEMATSTSQGWEGTLRGDYSTPSLVSNGSGTSSSSSPRTPSGARFVEEFVPRPSGLKASYTDTSEEDLEGTFGEGGRTSRLCTHRKHASSPLAQWSESEEDERYLRPATGAGAHPGSRPGTASSTATATSGSYLSFSTVPASTTTSRSASPTPAPVVTDKRDRDRVVQGGDEDEVEHACTMCGHRLPSPVPMEMHPMFTVPLVTVRATSAVEKQMQGGSDAGMGTRVPRYAKRRTSVPMSVASGVPPTSPSLISVQTNGGPVKTRTMVPLVSPSPPSASPSKVRKRHRPQTAPAGTGDAALKFIEDAKAMRVREGSVDVLVGAVDRVAKPKDKEKDKVGSGESRFKAVLKGLLRWAS